MGDRKIVASSDVESDCSLSPLLLRGLPMLSLDMGRSMTKGGCSRTHADTTWNLKDSETSPVIPILSNRWPVMKISSKQQESSDSPMVQVTKHRGMDVTRAKAVSVKGESSQSTTEPRSVPDWDTETCVSESLLAPLKTTWPTAHTSVPTATTQTTVQGEGQPCEASAQCLPVLPSTGSSKQDKQLPLDGAALPQPRPHSRGEQNEAHSDGKKMPMATHTRKTKEHRSIEASSSSSQASYQSEETQSSQVLTVNRQHATEMSLINQLQLQQEQVSQAADGGAVKTVLSQLQPLMSCLSQAQKKERDQLAAMFRKPGQTKQDRIQWKHQVALLSQRQKHLVHIFKDHKQLLHKTRKPLCEAETKAGAGRNKADTSPNLTPQKRISCETEEKTENTKLRKLEREKDDERLVNEEGQSGEWESKKVENPMVSQKATVEKKNLDHGAVECKTGDCTREKNSGPGTKPAQFTTPFRDSLEKLNVNHSNRTTEAKKDDRYQRQKVCGQAKHSMVHATLGSGKVELGNRAEQRQIVPSTLSETAGKPLEPTPHIAGCKGNIGQTSSKASGLTTSRKDQGHGGLTAVHKHNSADAPAWPSTPATVALLPEAGGTHHDRWQSEDALESAGLSTTVALTTPAILQQQSVPRKTAAEIPTANKVTSKTTLNQQDSKPATSNKHLSSSAARPSTGSCEEKAPQPNSSFNGAKAGSGKLDGVVGHVMVCDKEASENAQRCYHREADDEVTISSAGPLFSTLCSPDNQMSEDSQSKEEVLLFQQEVAQPSGPSFSQAMEKDASRVTKPSAVKVSAKGSAAGPFCVGSDPKTATKVQKASAVPQHGIAVHSTGERAINTKANIHDAFREKVAQGYHGIPKRVAFPAPPSPGSSTSTYITDKLTCTNPVFRKPDTVAAPPGVNGGISGAGKSKLPYACGNGAGGSGVGLLHLHAGETDMATSTWRTASKPHPAGQTDKGDKVAVSMNTVSKPGPAGTRPTLRELVRQGILKPGHNVLSLHTPNKTFFATLTEKGLIQSVGGERFSSPMKWCNPILSAGLGGGTIRRKAAFQRVLYKGTPLARFSLPSLTNARDGSVSVGEQTAATRTSAMTNKNTGNKEVSARALTLNPNVANHPNAASHASIASMLSRCRVVLVADRELVPSCHFLPHNFWNSPGFQDIKIPCELEESIDKW